MILLIDNYDSFSYNLFQLIGEIEPDIKIIRNDEMTIEEIKKLNPSRIILSPGPGRPEDAGIIIEASKNTRKGHPCSWGLPRPSGNLCGVRYDRYLCKGTNARKTVECKI